MSSGYFHRLAALPALPKFAQPLRHELADGVGRGVEYDGDVVILHLVDEAQQQRLALLGRELVEQRLDRLADAQHVLRFDHRVERGQRHPQSRLPVRKVAFVHPRTVQIDQAVVNDPEKVGLDVDDAAQVDLAGHNVEEYVVDDIAIEYVFGKNPNFFLKIFRHTGYESVLEGEVAQTGIGVVLRKNFQKFMDIFRRKKKVQVKPQIEAIENEKSGK